MKNETMTSVSSLDHAWRSATKRTKLSRPAARLRAGGYLRGRVLDYGCGHGDDANTLDCDRFDPHYAPDFPSGPYDVIMCTYVLNVIECPQARRNVLRELVALLDADGTAYVTVRTDRANLRGLTKTGSWQGLIMLDLPVVFKTSGFITYALGVGDENCRMSAKIF